MTATYTVNWTTEPPTTEGLYWFYGFVNGRHEKKGEAPGWHLCSVALVGDEKRPLIRVGSVFGWDRDPMVGHYCKILLPQLPVDACTPNVP